MAGTLISLSMLLYTSLLDLKSRSFYAEPVAAAGIAGAALRFLQSPGTAAVPALLAGCLPGLFLLLFSAATRGAIASGDVICITALGLIIGLAECLWVLCLALTAAALTGICIGVFGGRNIKTIRLPFTPFCLLAFLAVKALEA